MPRNIAIFGLLMALLTACGGASDAPDQAAQGGAGDVTVFTGATLIDGNGGDPIQDAVLVVQGDRFSAVGPAASVDIPEGAEVVDLAGKTIMPPLVAVHAHLAQTTDGFDNNAANFTPENVEAKLQKFASYGVLHVNSMGTDKPNVWDIIDRQRAGEISGARMYTAGRGFGAPVPGYPPFQAGSDDATDVYRLESPEEAEPAVAALAEHDPMFVKLWVDHHFHTLPEFDPEIYRAIVAAALQHGLRPVAHIHTYEDASRLLDAGVVGIVHSVRDRPVDQPLIDQYLANNAFSISTLAREESMFIYAGRTPYLDDPFFTEHHDQSVIDRLSSAEFQATHQNNPELAEWEPALRTAQQNLKTLFDAGVKIGFGSDSGPPARFEGYFEHRELELMQEAGLTPAQIIQIATKNSAEILQIDNDYGTIEPGKMAEFLVLGANPLENISNTKTLEEVWQNGRRIHDLR